MHNCEFNCLRVRPTDSSQLHHAKNLDHSRHNSDNSGEHYNENNAIMQGHAAGINGQNLNSAPHFALLSTANLVFSIILFIGTALFLVR